MRTYYVYILVSVSRVLYVGMTNDLIRRVWEHRNDLVHGFTKQYRVHRLVHFEQTADVLAAIAREKEVKKWRREKKLALVEASNPEWIDLWSQVCSTEVKDEIPRCARNDNG